MESKDKALGTAISTIKRSYGEGAIMRLGEAGPQREIQSIPTGALPLDLALGVGGIPKGRIIEIYGPESAGKTTLALHVIAESCTGGLLAAALTDLPGSSRHFAGGIVAYSNVMKHLLLGVSEDVLADRGAVSAEVAIAMAQGARERLGTDLALSVTGIAGPDADGSGKPVGLTFIGLAGADRSLVRQFNWKGERGENRRLSVEAALALALESLPELKP